MSAPTPKSRPKQTAAKWQAAALKVWRREGHDGPLPAVFVVACPGYYLNSMGKPGVNDRGMNDDAFAVFGPEMFVAFNGNTDPSIRKPGIATLRPGQIVWYRPGPHGIGRKTEHPAFRQDSPVVVRRDGQVAPAGTVHRRFGVSLGDGLWTDLGFSGRFWINLHRQFGGTSSAGCLTIPGDQWAGFRELVLLALTRSKAERFPCIVLDGPFA